ncbi:MAG: phosphatase [Pedosphaera sp.]|nr:phosphatase [Pedosphaera sp.]
MFADLHLHTHFSDGTYSPEELAGHARRHELTVVALTDHDTVDGCPRMAAACLAEGIEFIPAIEITAELDRHELHILGYGVEPTHSGLLAELARFQRIRQDRIRDIVVRLQKLNLPITSEAVFELANCNSPGRPHVARALIQAGVCKNLDEAFERFLKRHRPGWVPKARIHAEDAIRLIHEAGGAAVIAHPALNRCGHLIPDLARFGIDGIECFHSKHSPADSEHFEEMANRSGLLVTGGSDCHGMNKGQPLIGGVKLPLRLVEKLRDQMTRHRLAARSDEELKPAAC